MDKLIDWKGQCGCSCWFDNRPDFASMSLVTRLLPARIIPVKEVP